MVYYPPVVGNTQGSKTALNENELAIVLSTDGHQTWLGYAQGRRERYHAVPGEPGRCDA